MEQRKTFLAEMSWCVQLQTEAPRLTYHFLNNFSKPCFHSGILSATFLMFHLVFLKRNSTKLIMWYAEDLQFPEKHLAMPAYIYLSMLGDSYMSVKTVCLVFMSTNPVFLVWTVIFVLKKGESGACVAGCGKVYQCPKLTVFPSPFSSLLFLSLS